MIEAVRASLERHAAGVPSAADGSNRFRLGLAGLGSMAGTNCGSSRIIRTRGFVAVADPERRPGRGVGQTGPRATRDPWR